MASDIQLTVSETVSVLQAAMKARDSQRLDAIRFLSAAIKQREIELRESGKQVWLLQNQGLGECHLGADCSCGIRTMWYLQPMCGVLREINHNQSRCRRWLQHLQVAGVAVTRLAYRMMSCCPVCR